MLRLRNGPMLALRAATCWLVAAQFGVSVVLPAVDAALEAEPFSAPMHVESPGNEDCAAHHDHLFCQVVRSLSSAFRVASPPVAQAEPGVLLVFREDRPFSAVGPNALLPGAAHPRAPPLA